MRGDSIQLEGGSEEKTANLLSNHTAKEESRLLKIEVHVETQLLITFLISPSPFCIVYCII